MIRNCKPGVVSSGWRSIARLNSARSSSTISTSLLQQSHKRNNNQTSMLASTNKSIIFPYNLSNFSIRSFSSSETKNEEKTKKSEAKKESLEFKAETKQLLDIVTHSLYTDKEVFLRELISNASDALEKLRHLRVANAEGSNVTQQDPEIPLEIKIETDEVNGTITVSDTGVGLSKQDMIDHLGTIAKSGSKAFMTELAEKHNSESASMDISRGIIGKFGVGFYSAFMVGDKVEVRSK